MVTGSPSNSALPSMNSPVSFRPRRRGAGASPFAFADAVARKPRHHQSPHPRGREAHANHCVRSRSSRFCSARSRGRPNREHARFDVLTGRRRCPDRGGWLHRRLRLSKPTSPDRRIDPSRPVEPSFAPRQDRTARALEASAVPGSWSVHGLLVGTANIGMCVIPTRLEDTTNQ